MPDWLEGTVDTVVTYGESILTTPEVWQGAGETALGVVMMIGGGAGDIGGGALCITGVGCLAGAPAIVASTGLIVGGAYTATDGIGRLNDGLGQALREAQSKGSVTRKEPLQAGPKPAPSSLPAFPGASRAKPKTPVQGGGGLRMRWKDPKGDIYEWDSQHGTVEKYNKRGKHLGEYDPNTGTQTKPADKTREVTP
ncbi:colicin E3/pyocin S6 family cytotoxin [Streptomyces sp. NPDC007988]|uniref:colicin E3/pyocin S6 family cytotoxin n=1 Tax=Streptomyces sp. NPDC007988 TaxID=3364802 RepID=UPI0036E21146